MREPGVAALSSAKRRGVREAAIRVIGQSNAGDLQLVEEPALPRDPIAPRIGLLVALAALAGALAVAAYAIVREGASTPDWEPSLEDFEVERFFPSANGGEGESPATIERSLDEARGGRRS
jgi:hypothetical protein